MDINNAFEQTKEYNTGNNLKTEYLNFDKDGAYRFHIVSGFAALATHWSNNKGKTCFGMHRGCPICATNEKTKIEIESRQDMDEEDRKKELKSLGTSIQFACYVLHDEQLKLVKLPYSVAKKIKEWASDPDFQFNPDGSPDFDIKVTRESSGGITKYSTDIIPSSIGKVITLKEKVPNPEDYVMAMKKKAAKEAGLNPAEMSWSNKPAVAQEEELPVIDLNDDLEEDEIDTDSIPF